MNLKVLIVLLFQYTMLLAQGKSELERLYKNIRFKGLASTELTKRSFFVLDSISDLMKKDTFNYQIESYSSTYRKQEYNLLKTKKRAKLVKKILAGKGVEYNRLFPIWFGEYTFVYFCTRVGYSLNERMVIKKKENGSK